MPRNVVEASSDGPRRTHKCHPGAGWRSAYRGQLLDSKAGDRAADDELLDLLGALEDVHDLGVAVEALHGVLAHVAVAAQDLDRALRHPGGGAAGLELAHRALGVGVAAVVGEPRGAPHE